MKKFRIGKVYHYSEIEAEYDKIAENAELNEYGPELLIGESFIVLKTFDGLISGSFVMSDYNMNRGAYYKCIYKD